ncbi:hypothetical protein VNN41_04115 [Lactococcus garvieae]|uniref:hypothetical protein n=1 Tax=Lactococcus garvieae TaxID=1363 RepID=UPI0032525E37
MILFIYAIVTLVRKYIFKKTTRFKARYLLLSFLAMTFIGGYGYSQTHPEEISKTRLEQQKRTEEAEAKKQAESKKQAEAERQAALAQQAEAERQAALAQQAEAERQAALAQQAEAERQAVLAQQAEAERQAALAQQAEAEREVSTGGYSRDANGRWHRPNGQFASKKEIAAAGLVW